ncbi:MAG: hypothetical protein D6746_16065 [Bacteroidetes bacterium]|nr:MAG: hypothetical protein D6746_16065 [Bacteroidota bacterium]
MMSFEYVMRKMREQHGDKAALYMARQDARARGDVEGLAWLYAYLYCRLTGEMMPVAGAGVRMVVTMHDEEGREEMLFSFPVKDRLWAKAAAHAIMTKDVDHLRMVVCGKIAPSYHQYVALTEEERDYLDRVKTVVLVNAAITPALHGTYKVSEVDRQTWGDMIRYLHFNHPEKVHSFISYEVVQDLHRQLAGVVPERNRESSKHLFGKDHVLIIGSRLKKRVPTKEAKREANMLKEADPDLYELFITKYYPQ